MYDNKNKINATQLLLGLSVAFVMLIGSVPLGFAEPVNVSESIEISDSDVNKKTTQKLPLRVQHKS